MPKTRLTTPVPATQEEFLSAIVRPTAVCAAWAGMPEATVRRLVEDGVIPAIRVGRVWRVNTAGFLRALDGSGHLV